MDFKAYDLLATLIPGFLIVILGITFLEIPYNKDAIIAYTVLAYFIGYIINALGSWLERFYVWTWGGKTHETLLMGEKQIWKVPFYSGKKVKELLENDPNVTKKENMDDLFYTAKQFADLLKDSRVADMNASYAFSRSLLTAGIIGCFMVLPYEWKNHKFYIVSIPLLIILWLRSKQRSSYYAREVLSVYFNKKSETTAVK